MKKRTTKHQTTIIKEQLMVEFKITSSRGSENWNLQHCSTRIKDNNDHNRIKELVDLFNIANVKESPSLKEFYWWYKENPISRLDSLVYAVFDVVSEQLELPQANPTSFSKMGSQLINRIIVWRGNAGNELEDILLDYFLGILPMAIAWNPALSTQPKSLLSEYGWGLFEQFLLEFYGGKALYLDANKEQLEQAKKDNEMLKIIQAKKDNALLNNDLNLYDKIGHLLTKKTIGEIYYDTIGQT